MSPKIPPFHGLRAPFLTIKFLNRKVTISSIITEVNICELNYVIVNPKEVNLSRKF